MKGNPLYGIIRDIFRGGSQNYTIIINDDGDKFLALAFLRGLEELGELASSLDGVNSHNKIGRPVFKQDDKKKRLVFWPGGEPIVEVYNFDDRIKNSNWVITQLKYDIDFRKVNVGMRLYLDGGLKPRDPDTPKCLVKDIFLSLLLKELGRLNWMSVVIKDDAPEKIYTHDGKIYVVVDKYKHFWKAMSGLPKDVILYAAVSRIIEDRALHLLSVM